MTEDGKSVREYVEKLADDKLAEVMGHRVDAKPKAEPVRTWRKWEGDELEWESAKPRVTRVEEGVSGKRGKRQQYGVSVYRPEEWAAVVRPQGGVVVLSDFMVTQVADILMREMCDVLERAQLIFTGEDASQRVRAGMRKIVEEYVCFLDKTTGEYSDVEVE